jgi:hypothetical protein
MSESFIFAEVVLKSALVLPDSRDFVFVVFPACAGMTALPENQVSLCISVLPARTNDKLDC